MENQTKTKNLYPRVSGPKLFLRLSVVKVPKQKCVGNPITSAIHNFQSESDSFLKMQNPFFEPADKASDTSAGRTAQLEQIVGRLTLALDIQKNVSLTYLS